MPKYRALRQTWLSHECRTIREGQEFTTEFPKVKNHRGEVVEMKLGDNLELVEEVKGKGKGGDLAG